MQEDRATHSSVELLIGEAAGIGIRIDPKTAASFGQLLELLRASNANLNLTAIRDPEDIVGRHFLESIALGVLLSKRGLLTPAARLLDLGSGAGFPGLPLKLVWPEIELYLLEATSKKAAFIATAVSTLQLHTAYVLDGRAEEFARDQSLREQFDLVVARGVVPLPALVELGLPFLRVGGVLAAMKGSRAADEIAAARTAIELCGGALIEDVPSLGIGNLRAVLIGKSSPTPDRFPRRSGQPAAHPLRNRN